MEQHLELFAALAAPFTHDEVRVRPQGTRQIQYITARTVMNRLDDVLGPAGWWDEYVPQENSVICKLTIRLPDGTILTKSDAGGYAGMSDSGDDDKSGFSDAFKRAAVKFGIGRYLYRDGVPRFVHEATQPSAPGPMPERSAHDHPAMHPPASGPQAARGGSERQGAPQTGKALFAWIKQQDESHGLGLFKSVSEWASRHEFPERMVQWNNEQVHRAYAEAQALIHAPPHRDAEQQAKDGASRVAAAPQDEGRVQPRTRRSR
jgi:hypothetical protein